MSDNSLLTPGVITDLAIDSLLSEEAVLDIWSSPESILEYLENNKDKTLIDLSLLLKRAIVQKGLCSETSDDKEFIKVLFSLLTKQKEDINEKYGLQSNDEFKARCFPLLNSVISVTNKNTVERWINGFSININNRGTLIMICTALGLSKDETNTLLNKCGFTGLNIRSAQEAVLLYCTANQLPLTEAIEIYDEYLKAAPETFTDKKETIKSTDTTRRLDEMLDALYKGSKEEFLNTFLIPNKGKFISYSKLGYKEYLKIKIPFFLTAIYEGLEQENQNGLIDLKLRNDSLRRKHKDDSLRKITDSQIKLSSSFFKELKKAEKEGNSIIHELFEAGFYYGYFINPDGAVINNLPESCEYIARLTTKNKDDFEFLYEMNEFVSNVISWDDVFRILLPAIISEKTERKNPYSASKTLKETVFFKFPSRQSLKAYEGNLAEYGITDYIRKGIVLMYFYAFLYEFTADYNKASFFDRCFSENTFEGFINDVNAVLLRCRYAPLYPANHFDRMVLLTVRKIELTEPDELEKCRDYLNDVIETAFNEGAEQCSAPSHP